MYKSTLILGTIFTALFNIKVEFYLSWVFI